MTPSRGLRPNRPGATFGIVWDARKVTMSNGPDFSHNGVQGNGRGGLMIDWEPIMAWADAHRDEPDIDPDPTPPHGTPRPIPGQMELDGMPEPCDHRWRFSNSRDVDYCTTCFATREAL